MPYYRSSSPPPPRRAESTSPNWYFSSNGDVIGKCYLATTSAVENGPRALGGSAASDQLYPPIALNRMFAVPAGTTTYFLNCLGESGIAVAEPAMTAMFYLDRF